MQLLFCSYHCPPLIITVITTDTIIITDDFASGKLTNINISSIKVISKKVKEDGTETEIVKNLSVTGVSLTTGYTQVLNKDEKLIIEYTAKLNGSETMVVDTITNIARATVPGILWVDKSATCQTTNSNLDVKKGIVGGITVVDIDSPDKIQYEVTVTNYA